MSAQLHGAGPVAMPSSPEPAECDVLVLGSGVGGLSAALSASLRGLKSIVAEKSPWYGGTSSWSGGWIWVPCNHLAMAAGVPDSLEQARLYLRERLGAEYNDTLIDAYLQGGIEMVREYMENTEVRFESGGFIFPDYHTDAPGALQGAGQSRSLRTAGFDARRLSGPMRARLRPMLPQLTLGGMLLGSLVEAQHFVNALRSPRSAAFVARKSLRYAWDRLVHGRDMQLVNGLALVARHAASLERLGTPIWVNAPATELVREGERVAGAVIAHEGRQILVRARRGVVLACGGFPHDETRKQRFYSHVGAGGRHYGIAPMSNTGDGLTMGEAVGASIIADRPWNCLFMPASRLPGAPEPATFPHIWDRSKPGFIAVTTQGRRFVNEAAPYMIFGQAMVKACAAGTDTRAWLLCDSRALRRYGLGVVRPLVPLGPHLRSGYLQRAHSIAELALRVGVPAEPLVQTVERYNADAERGVDSEFAKGADAFSRFQGDPEHRPNPNMAPLLQPPFFAVEIFCADFGTFTGLRANAHAQVLRAADGMPISGLYAAGNDMAIVMGSHSVGGGITLGPAMVFGHLAARHMAGDPPVAW